jgi:hypothetical protein
MKHHNNDLPDGPMSAEQQAVASSLAPEFVAKVDAALMSHAKRSTRKVAMIVGMAMMDSSVRVAGLPDLFYRDRVRVLVNKGLLVAEGNLEYMRYSEVRLPQ